jgi:hypothetical protein
LIDSGGKIACGLTPFPDTPPAINKNKCRGKKRNGIPVAFQFNRSTPVIQEDKGCNVRNRWLLIS